MSEYRRESFTNAVLKAAPGNQVVVAVLMYMCKLSDFDRPEVTLTKSQIAQVTKLSHKSVQRAIKTLVSGGTLEIIDNARGGRGNAPRYRLLIAVKGDSQSIKGDSQSIKGDSQGTPTLDSIDSMTRRGAGRPANGIKRKWKPSGQDGQPGSAGKSEKHGARGAPLTPAERVDAERFYRAMKIAGTYGEARALVAAWDAGEVEEPVAAWDAGEVEEPEG